MSQLNTTSKTPNPNSNFNGVSSAVGKRRKSKPVRYGGSSTIVESLHSPSKYNNFGFPQSFGKLFLPKIDCEMVLEDENGHMHLLGYNSKKNGLSAGWKKCASGHNLVEGGALVFHLVESYKFKIAFIIISPKRQKDFRIMVSGVCVDSELPEDVRMDYDKLCSCRKELLHDSVSKNCYHKLVVGMIGETVNIGNKIKNCEFTTSKEEFDAWDNSLKLFTQLGMKVDFLRDRILTLSKLVFESEDREDIVKYVAAKNELKPIEDEIKSMTEKLVELNESSRKLTGIIDGLKQKTRIHEVKFQELLDAQW